MQIFNYVFIFEIYLLFLYYLSSYRQLLHAYNKKFQPLVTAAVDNSMMNNTDIVLAIVIILNFFVRFK